ncbi:hypothetical protein NCC49_005777 [Naganishia albida]|nr:hypothetical protein NCC49_005777 [Naganishia albida]
MNYCKLGGNMAPELMKELLDLVRRETDPDHKDTVHIFSADMYAKCIKGNNKSDVEWGKNLVDEQALTMVDWGVGGNTSRDGTCDLKSISADLDLFNKALIVFPIADDDGQCTAIFCFNLGNLPSKYV